MKPLLLALALGSPWAQAQIGSAPCPGLPPARLAQVQLTVITPQRALELDAVALAQLPATTLVQQQSVAAAGAASGAALQRREWQLSGVLARDVLLAAGFGEPGDRAARNAWVEALASDGYRALFSWGELFNSPAGDQVLVIRAQDGRTLDSAAGPLALRSLGDLRPGPRHVRQLCALIVRG
ncbi:MAG: sulfite oxidase-like oxidoreductase [Rubrivivax sp.]|nr:sulfite oxidase-like oxidoreductase [Rubrivivax sp.]